MGCKDFIAYVKKNQSTIKLGSAGVGATGGVDCAIFNGMIGVNIQAIPYRGSGPAMQDLIGRQFDYFCTISGSAAAPLQNDLIKGIAVFRHERLPSLPNVPTAFEQGMDFDASTWFGFFVPKGTPAAIIKKLHDASVGRDGNALGAGATRHQRDIRGVARQAIDRVFAKHHRSRDREERSAAQGRGNIDRVSAKTDKE